jgi:hypothetical protein
MIAGVLAVYWAPGVLSGRALLWGADYWTLHVHRIDYAREALSGPEHELPGWYSRELLGTPFWSNTQNFPFIPTRFPLLFLDPARAFSFGINLAAVLAAVFTYLYARRISLAPLPAAAAGWTFACSGYFAARVLVGHLPLHEGYPALPLLLWVAESAIQEEASGRAPGRWLLALGLAAAAVSLAGHPQLSVYALACTGIYLLYRDPGRRVWKRGAALALGPGIAAFSLLPMLLLLSRSTRFLELDPPDNDVALPWRRIAAFALPWRDGWPAVVERLPAQEFVGYPNPAYFWETVCYVGLLPLAAVAFLALRCVLQRRRPSGVGLFFAVLGAASLLLALSELQAVLKLVPGTFLRAPARQLYMTIFALSLAGGALLHTTLTGFSRRRTGFAWALTLLLLGLHFADLHAHDRPFLVTEPLPGASETERHAAPAEALPAAEDAGGISPRRIDFADLLGETPAADSLEPLQARLADGRMAVDLFSLEGFNRKVDDVGYFDSVMLARVYRALLDMSDFPPGYNNQQLSGDALNHRTLAYAGVKLIHTAKLRRDLEPVLVPGSLVPAYAIRDAAPRAQLLPLRAALYLEPESIHARLRDQDVDLQARVMLPVAARPAPSPADASARAEVPPSRVDYRRDSGDVIHVHVEAAEPGYLRLTEAWDEGWSAHLDGEPTELLLADDFVMAVALPAGEHEVELRFETPGAGTGLLVAGTSLLALLVLSAWNLRPDLRPR